MVDEAGLVGKQIGSYLIIDVLNNGSYGTVYTGKHIIFDGEPLVAIKVMHAPLGSSQEQQKFAREANLLKLLKHPYILPISDASIQGNLAYLVMEYAPGGSLRDRIDQQQGQLLPLDEAVTILSHIGQALYHAHQHKIVHRDLKPENILFNARGEALLADFGIAAVLSSVGTHYLGYGGTPAYMAPEMFEGKVSTRSDQYALGCIAYELVTGHKPFEVEGVPLIAVQYQHAYTEPAPPTHFSPQLPSSVERAILQAMAKDRLNRHEDMHAFLLMLQNTPKSFRYWLEEGDTHYAARRYEEAAKAFSHVIELHSTYAAYFKRGLTYYALHEFEEAVADFSLALKQEATIEAYHMRGLAHQGLKEYKRAINDFDRVIKRQPQNTQFYYNRGKAYKQLERYEKALEDFEHALAINENFVPAKNEQAEVCKLLKRQWLEEGDVLLTDKHYEEAIAAFNRVLKLEHDNAQAYYSTGLAYFYLNEYEKAIAQFDCAIAQEDNNAQFYCDRGKAYKQWKEYQKAIADFDRALEIVPNFEPARSLRVEILPTSKEQWLKEGNAHLTAKRYQEAVIAYSRVIALDPNNIQIYRNRGKAYKQLQNYQQAIENYDRVLALDPQDAQTYHNRGLACYVLKQYQEAIKDFDRAIVREPKNAQMYYSRGKAYRQLNEYQKAIADFDRALELNRNLDRVRSERAEILPTFKEQWLEEGNAHLTAKRYQEAVAAYDRVLTFDSACTSAYLKRGLAYHALKNHQKAISDFNYVIEREPKNALV